MTRLPVAERIERDRAIARLRDIGVPVDTIAEKLHVNRRTVFRVVKRGGPSEAALRDPERVNVERDAEIVQFATSKDDLGNYPALSDIAEWYGISRERVRQILRANGVPMLQTGAKRRKFLAECKQPGCEDTVENHSSRYCLTHRPIPKGSVTVTCSWCGKTKDVPLRDIEAANRHWRTNRFRTEPPKHHFCDRRCHGKWFGSNYSNGRPKVAQ